MEQYMTLPNIRILFLFSLLILLSSLSTIAAPKGKGPANERMDKASSPYLRSHSNDLVRWYEWGPDAFTKALNENKPIIVSFGYTACHWCHVMQEKHFNNADIAKEINEHFIPILVDRERRTNLDDTYMLVTEILTRRGGWPNTVFLSPQLKPFYGTAYIPPKDFSQLLNEVKTNWKNNNASLVNESHRIAAILSRYLTRREKAREVTPEVLLKAAKSLLSQFDSFHGGMGTAPKFFRPTVLMFMLNQYEHSGDKNILEALERTLQSIASGGIHDHIEGGFHRYAVDPKWRIPHFEKMLNDQALMAGIYIKAYMITGKEEYKKTAKKTLNYILTDLTSPKGGFYTARDADSEGEEGTYYIWTKEQLEKILDKDDAKFAVNLFEIVTEGELEGKIVVHKDNLENKHKDKATKILAQLERIRANRPKPIRDEKILANWNAMAISTFSNAALVLRDEVYKQAAMKAAEFIWVNMRGEKGNLFRSYYKGTPSVEAGLEDYASLANSFLSLFDLTKDDIWLKRANELAAIIKSDFEDQEYGDFFGTKYAEGFLRSKPRNDVDQPSGNGAALKFLARLGKRIGAPEKKHDLEKAIAQLSGIALSSPGGSASILYAIDIYLQGEATSVQYAGSGVVRVEAMPIENGKLKLDIFMKKGWHINSNTPLEKDFIPTKISLHKNNDNIKSVTIYPQGKQKKLSFNQKSISLYEDRIQIITKPETKELSGMKARIELQACSDKVCLLPETLQFRIR